MKSNVLVVHGGGPTAVMNASLYGVIREAGKHTQIGKVYGAIGGMEGIIKEQFFDLSGLDRQEQECLPATPGSAIGSSRYPISDVAYDQMAQIVVKHNIGYLLPNGGNGTMEACGKLYQACKKLGYVGIKIVGIPKTIDNDLAITDHTPGYGSAARYIAETVREIAEDVKSLPIHVCVIEALGRNSGWITAASALARNDRGDAPHLIYPPEKPFCEEQFLRDVKKLHERLGGVVVVVSEGLKNKEGVPIVPPIFQSGRAVYYGDVSAHLAHLVTKKLGIKARSEKPGLAGRASIAWQSSVDKAEAIMAGETAMQWAVAGKTGVMVGIERVDDPAGNYKICTVEIPIEQVMLHEKTLPDAYISSDGNDVTEAFIKWCRPLLGKGFEPYVDLRRHKERK